MAVFNNILAGASGQGGAAAGYTIDRSLRFNSGDSSHLKKIFGSDGTLTAWTLSCWVKRSALGTNQMVFTSGDYGAGAAARSATFRFGTGDKLEFQMYKDGGVTLIAAWVTTQVFRDLSAWQHLVLIYDSSNGTAADRTRLYVNGTRVTAFDSTPTYPSPSQDSAGINTTGPTHYFGGFGGTSATSQFLSAYLADVHFIDGQALDPTDFGEFDDNNVWQPKAYTGTFGTNGFHLKFDNTSDLGEDAAGSNDWTVNNISAFSSTGNYAAYVYESNATYDGTATGTSYYTGAGSNFNLFDGNTATLCGGGNSGGSWLYFRPGSSITSVTSLRVHASYVEEIRVNGSVATVSPTLPATGSQWYTISSPPSTITEIAVKGHVSQGAAARASAIEINGSILIDNSFASDNDSLFDSPTNGTQTDTGAGGEVSGNYATWNPLSTLATLSDGNLKITTGAVSYHPTLGTIGMSSGKWYWEGEWVSGNNRGWGIATANTSSTEYLGESTSWGYMYSGNKVEPSNSQSAYGSSFTTGDIVGVAFDADNGNLYFYKNGVAQNSGTAAFTGLTSGPYFPFTSNQSANSGVKIGNFGQRPFVAGPGTGGAAPSGYKALCTANLDDPTIADGSTAMDVVTYSGNSGDGLSTTQDITTGFSPDMVWIKSRTDTNHHVIFDTVRGAGKRVFPSRTVAEDTKTQTLNTFNSDGFTLNGDNSVNDVGVNYVAWTWDGGSSTVSNTDGSITSSVRANASAGFSIVTYSGNLTTTGSETIGHGLNVAPQLVISKSRTVTGAEAGNWAIQHSSLPATHILRFDSAASSAKSGLSAPTSTVFTTTYTVGLNTNGNDYVAYCWAPVEGYSAFGSYTGNGLSDGTFVYTGFRPRFLLVKRTNTTGYWFIFDSERPGYNVIGGELYPNDASSEGTGARIDFCSNGFKYRDSGSGINALNSTYIYAAFAETPQKFARAR